jgi:hypothetical protein
MVQTGELVLSCTCAGCWSGSGILVQAGGVSQSVPVVWRIPCANSVEGEAGFAKHCKTQAQRFRVTL